MTEDQFDTLKAIVTRARGVHGSIARDVYPHGVVLSCHKCGAEIHTKRTADYFAHGWPKCCGLTMSATKAEAADV